MIRLFFFQAEDGIRDLTVTGVQTCALPISSTRRLSMTRSRRRWPQLRRLKRVWAWRRVATLTRPSASARDRKSVVEGKSVELGGRRIIRERMVAVVRRAGHGRVTVERGPRS